MKTGGVAGGADSFVRGQGAARRTLGRAGAVEVGRRRGTCGAVVLRARALQADARTVIAGVGQIIGHCFFGRTRGSAAVVAEVEKPAEAAEAEQLGGARFAGGFAVGAGYRRY